MLTDREHAIREAVASVSCAHRSRRASGMCDQYPDSCDCLKAGRQVVGVWARLKSGQGPAKGDDSGVSGSSPTSLDPFEPDGPPAANCRAYQMSDQMVCPCGLAWDVNDPEPPVCRKQ